MYCVILLKMEALCGRCLCCNILVIATQRMQIHRVLIDKTEEKLVVYGSFIPIKFSLHSLNFSSNFKMREQSFVHWWN